MYSSKRTQCLADLRTIRNELEASYDKLRDLSPYNLPLAREAQEKLREALTLLKQEIDYGEHHTVYAWPPSPLPSTPSTPASPVVQTAQKPS